MNTRRSTGPKKPSYATAAQTVGTHDQYVFNAKFCGLIAKRPYMYDRSNPFYLKKSKMNRAWLCIAKEVNQSVNDCKDRWRSIRGSYARSINVHHAAYANRVKPYYLHKELTFLTRHITPGGPVSSCSEDDETDANDVDDDNDDADAHVPHSKHPRRGDTQARDRASAQRSRLHSESNPTQSSFAEDDADDSFLRSLRPELQQMTFHQKLHFKHRMFEVLKEIFSVDPNKESGVEIPDSAGEYLTPPTLPSHTFGPSSNNLYQRLSLPRTVQQQKDHEV